MGRPRRGRFPVSQKTLVLRVPPAEQAALEERLRPEAFTWRTVPHARFSIRGDGVVATLYRSGKLVVQGAQPETFVARFLGAGAVPDGPAARAGGAAERQREPALDVVTVGSDECGKGDYLGPLVVCAVRLTPDEARRITDAGVVDSKRLSDSEALRLGGALRTLPHAVRRVDPPEYNALHERVGNLNEILADLHAEVIRELAVPGGRVVVDRFARESLLARRLAGLPIDLVQLPRAESEPAVAAASVIAREEFLTALRELGDELGCDLAKGAGAPADRAARAIVRLHGRGGLARAAKLHFKNTGKVLG